MNACPHTRAASSKARPYPRGPKPISRRRRASHEEAEKHLSSGLLAPCCRRKGKDNCQQQYTLPPSTFHTPPSFHFHRPHVQHTSHQHPHKNLQATRPPDLPARPPGHVKHTIHQHPHKNHQATRPLDLPNDNPPQPSRTPQHKETLRRGHSTSCESAPLNPPLKSPAKVLCLNLLCKSIRLALTGCSENHSPSGL